MAKTLTTTSIAVTINGNDYSKHFMFPFKVSNLLDEQLDEASLTLIGVPEKNFKPLTDVIVTLTNDNKTQSYSMLVASDKADEIPTGSGRYKHELYLIEQTKYLECFIVRSIGFVNPLEKEYKQIEIEPSIRALQTEINWWGDNKMLKPMIKTPIYKKDSIITLPSLKEFYTTGEHPTTADPYITVLDYMSVGYETRYTKMIIRDANYNIIGEWGRNAIYNEPKTIQIPDTTMLIVQYNIGYGYSAVDMVTARSFYEYTYYITVV